MPERIIISGGGTGGHIFPAIAIANAIKRMRPDSEILFVGAEGKMEMEKVPAAGYKIKGLWISGLQRKLSLNNLAFPFKVISSLLRCRKIIKEFKPDVAVGVGGFASGPMLFAASTAGVPCLIQEQNSFPGITNKILSGRAKKICVAYPGMDKYFPKSKIILTGNPVRKEVIQLDGKRARGMEEFGLDPEKKTIFFVGGSQGALSINRYLSENMDKLLADPTIQILWQTGRSYVSIARAKESSRVVVRDFINRMDLAYAVADIVVSRAGASAVSELSLIGKPCIFIPFPFAAEDHQTKNAQALVNYNAALLIPDAQIRIKLTAELLELVHDEERRQKFTANIKKLGLQNADDVIASEVLSLIK